MPPVLHYRMWNEDPPDYGIETDMFSAEVIHNGFFCGMRDNLAYESSSSASFDYCSAKNWSVALVDEILKMLDYERDGRLHVYWCMPDKDIDEGLVPIDTDVQCAEMSKASVSVKTLVLYVDHTNFLRLLRNDVIKTGRGGGFQPPRTGTGQDEPEAATGRPETRKRGYNTAPGSMHHLLFGPNKKTTPTNIPDLNEQVLPDLNVHEIACSQSAPPPDEML